MCLAQVREPAFAMNERLGRGINMGNSFEAPSENEWGNPWQPSYFRSMSALGFSHVRLPVRWEPEARSMASPPYTIDVAFMRRIQQVVDTALKYKLHIIVNMHHHEALYEDPAGQKERFLSQWRQIAQHFKDYPDSLLFEVLNEPHGNLTPALWNEYFAEALDAIRETNPTRIVLMGVADYGGLGGISKLAVPEDDHIILSVHYYNPFTFTHQGAEWVNGADAWLGTEWRDTEAERESVVSEFNYALHFAETHHLPIHIGEFGAYSKADVESRKKWTTFLARWFEEQNMSWAYWEFSAGFGIYNPATGEYLDELVDALLHNEMPEATPVAATPVYASNFSGGADGWSLVQQGGAAGSLTVIEGKLDVTITSPGTEAWHLQLIKHDVALRKGRSYRLTYTIQAEQDRSISFYAGRASAPWSIYSNGGAVSISASTQTFVSTFTMGFDTDLSSRLVFDLGNDVTDVKVSNVQVDELSFGITGIAGRAEGDKVSVYPNPATSSLHVTSAWVFYTAELFDLRGRRVTYIDNVDSASTLDVRDVPPGLYILVLTGRDDVRSVLKVFKK